MEIHDSLRSQLLSAYCRIIERKIEKCDHAFALKKKNTVFETELHIYVMFSLGSPQTAHELPSFNSRKGRSFLFIPRRFFPEKRGGGGKLTLVTTRFFRFFAFEEFGSADIRLIKFIKERRFDKWKLQLLEIGKKKSASDR